MELTILWAIAQRELREALRNRWLWFFAGGFTLLALALARAGLAASGYAGLGGFGRTAASLVNALLLFVPLIGLTTGASAISSDRERGSLLFLLAQPVSHLEVFLGKALGAALAVIASISLGFGLAGLALASSGPGNAGAYLALTGATLMLALVSLGLGFVLGTAAHKASTANGAALILWLGLVFFLDLGLIGATLSFRPTPSVLLGLLLANPLQVFKLSAIYGLRASLDALGPVGHYAVYRFGPNISLVFTGLLAAWILGAFGAAYLIFNRRRDL